MEGRRGDRSKSVDKGSTDLDPGVGGRRKGLVLGGTKRRLVQAMAGPRGGWPAPPLPGALAHRAGAGSRRMARPHRGASGPRRFGDIVSLAVSLDCTVANLDCPARG